MGRRMSAPVYLKAAPRTLTIQLTSVANSCNWERKVIADNARVGEQVVILDYVQRGGCRGDADCVAPERVKVLDFLPKRDTQRVRGEPLRGGPGCWQRLPAPWYLSLILHCNDIGLAYASPGYFVSWSRPTLCDRVNLDVRIADLVGCKGKRQARRLEALASFVVETAADGLRTLPGAYRDRGIHPNAHAGQSVRLWDHRCSILPNRQTYRAASQETMTRKTPRRH